MSSSSAQKINKRIYAKKRAWVFTPNDFLDITSRSNVDFVLHHLVKKGTIRRLDRGLYDFPKVHPKLGVLSPDPFIIAQAIARKDQKIVQTSGAKAANILGLSTQVPAKNVYLIQGGNKKDIKIGKNTVSLRPTNIPSDKNGDLISLILQALFHLGKKHISSDVIKTCSQKLSQADKKKLQQRIHVLKTSWLRDAARKVAI